MIIIILFVTELDLSGGMWSVQSKVLKYINRLKKGLEKNDAMAFMND